MSFNQWKIINQFKELLWKRNPEWAIMYIVNKEWINLLRKFPRATGVFHSVSVQRKSHHGNLTPSNQSKTDSISIESAEQKLNEPLRNNAPHEPPPVESKPQDSRSYGGYGEYGLQVIEGLKQKLSSKTQTTAEVPLDISSLKWKNQYNIATKDCIVSRSRHVLSLISTAQTVDQKRHRLVELIQHLNQFPEAKGYLVKDGAVTILLRMRDSVNDTPIQKMIREIFARLGHVDPVPGWGIRILSIDGGGMRGIVVLEMLRRFEELTGKKVCEMFDYICGVSTGAILACGIGTPCGKSLDEVQTIYREMSAKVFTQSAFWGTGKLMWNHAYYDTTIWEELLKRYLGDVSLIETTRDPNCPKLAAVSTLVNQARVLPYVFRNYALPYERQSQYLGSCNHTMFEAVRASAAAPTIFEEFRIGSLLHQDGGILVNNPTAVAIHEAKQLWPNSPIQCVVSFGTGRHDPVRGSEPHLNSNESSSWKKIFNKILDSATDTEAVHTMLNDLLPGNVYFRFNPYLSEIISMDEYRPEKIARLETDALMYYRRNEEKFIEAASAILQTRTYSQRCQDYVVLQAKKMGIKHV